MPVIEIRHCEKPEDYAACERLQSLTWGAEYREVVTASLLKVSRRVGGVVAVASLGAGEIVGFVFGLTGVRGGRLVHWSHMLAVAESYRDRGVGRRLKAFQFEALRGLGVESAYWTFDPLVARNAHLNLNRLRTTLEEYVPDMYADTGSDLHAFGTDRLVVSWALSNGAVHGPGPLARNGVSEVVEEGDEPFPGNGSTPFTGNGDAPVLNVDRSGIPLRVPREPGPGPVRIAIPTDIEGLLSTDLAELKAWRVSVRAAFEACLGRGYRPLGFERGEERSWYVLDRGPGAV